MCQCSDTYPCILRRLELNDSIIASDGTNAKNQTAGQEDNSSSIADADSEIPLPLKRAYLIYLQAYERVKDIKFIIELLNLTKGYKNTEKLQKKIVWYGNYMCILISFENI